MPVDQSRRGRHRRRDRDRLAISRRLLANGAAVFVAAQGVADDLLATAIDAFGR